MPAAFSPRRRAQSRAVWHREAGSVNPPTSGCEVAADECEAECEISSYVWASNISAPAASGTLLTRVEQRLLPRALCTFCRGVTGLCAALPFWINRQRAYVWMQLEFHSETYELDMQLMFHVGGVHIPPIYLFFFVSILHPGHQRSLMWN